jgi:hypothetical protein
MAGLMLVVLLLAGCGETTAKPIATPTAVSLTATPTPVPPTATLTPIPMTATPTPIIAQANATFAGSMTISKVGNGASAERGEIEFMTSDDGTEIVSVSVTLFEMNCAYEYDVTFAGVTQSGSGTETAASGTVSTRGTFPITDGKFNFDIQGMQGTGQITSLTEANGVIVISQEINLPNLPPNANVTCDYGTWNWNTIAQ